MATASSPRRWRRRSSPPRSTATFRALRGLPVVVRCNLHFLAGRAEERLTFDVQRAMADTAGLRRGRRPARGRALHEALLPGGEGRRRPHEASCARRSEMEQLKRLAAHQQRCSIRLTWRTRRRIRRKTNFRIDNGRLNVADPSVFERDPVNLIRIFAERGADRHFPPSNAVRLLRESLRLIDDEAARRSGGEPHLHRDARPPHPGDDATAHERGRRARPLRAGIRPGRGA